MECVPRSNSMGLQSLSLINYATSNTLPVNNRDQWCTSNMAPFLGKSNKLLGGTLIEIGPFHTGRRNYSSWLELSKYQKVPLPFLTTSQSAPFYKGLDFLFHFWMLYYSIVGIQYCISLRCIVQWFYLYLQCDHHDKPINYLSPFEVIKMFLYSLCCRLYPSGWFIL